MNLLKNCIVENGSTLIETLYGTPSTSVSHEGIDGVFTPDHVDKLIAVLKSFLKIVGEA